MTALAPQEQAPVYDAAGNMIADHRGYLFTYDHENRLRRVEKAGTPNVLLASFRYDALGRRVEMVDESAAPAVVTRYVYDGDNVVAAYEQDGQSWLRRRYYVHGTTYIDERAVLHDDSGDRDYYYVLDDLYTVAGLADEVGNVFESYDHDAYGTPTMTAHTFSDLDGDGDVDGTDFLIFSNCFNGSSNPPLPGCANPMADLDRDGDVDGTDFLTFSNCSNGANNPPNCAPRDFAVGASPAGNAYFFTGRRLDAFDFDAGSGGEEATGGSGESTMLPESESTLSTSEMSQWLCFYSSAGGPQNPLDFDGSGAVDAADLTWFDNCVADAGGSTEGATTESTLSEPLAGESATASAGSTPGLLLYHYRARAHDPGLGRFMQRDPIGVVNLTSSGGVIFSHPYVQYTDGMNIYEHARSSPVRWSDPTGLACSGWVPTGPPFPRAVDAKRVYGGRVQCIWATCQTRTRTCTSWWTCGMTTHTETKTKCNKPVPFITTVLLGPAAPPGARPGLGAIDPIVYCNNFAPGPGTKGSPPVVPLPGGAPPPGLPGPPPVGAW